MEVPAGWYLRIVLVPGTLRRDFWQYIPCSRAGPACRELSEDGRFRQHFRCPSG